MNSTPLDISQSYICRGWLPLPVPFKSKNPNFKGWQHFSVSEKELPAHFNGQPQNIGVLLGKSSGGLTDIDLDCPESIALATYFLPSSNAVFGRISNPRSHYLYVVTGDEAKTIKFEDTDGRMLLELRYTGCQTIFPGSTHPSGEIIDWHTNGEPSRVPYIDLSCAVRRIAAACLIVRHYPVKGSRNNLALALAGGLLRAGWTEQETEQFISAICTVAQDEETSSRVQTVIGTGKKLAGEEKATGWPTVAKYLNQRVIDKVREWLGISSHEVHEQPIETQSIVSWPELHPAALYGISGDFVRKVEPHSESDPVALLIQFLIGVGNLIGRGAHFLVEADRHYTNIFAVLVGDTGTGRKGTSWGQVKRVVESLDETWARECISGGLSSGEGLIYNVRDAVVSKKPIKAGGEETGVDGHVIADTGVTDKRLLVFEGEFASVLRAQGRDGNTLSMVIRNLWDTGNARSMVKNAPTRTTGAHVSIVGHITKQELRNCLDDVESVNGYVNRFLWVCTQRSKYLSRGGKLSSEDFAPIIRHLRECIDFSRTVSEMTFDDEAGAMWDSVYIGLETGRTGLLGKVTQRASPYVLRLSCLYALLDCSAIVRREHLAAALSLWKYCEDSARYIFGERTGDRLADNLLRALREAEADGLTRTDISNLSGRNISAARISSALASLAEAGLAHARRERVEDSKRPVERWFAGLQQSAIANEVNEINEVNAKAAD